MTRAYRVRWGGEVRQEDDPSKYAAPGWGWALWTLACKHWEPLEGFTAGVQNNHIGLWERPLWNWGCSFQSQRLCNQVRNKQGLNGEYFWDPYFLKDLWTSLDYMSQRRGWACLWGKTLYLSPGSQWSPKHIKVETVTLCSWKSSDLSSVHKSGIFI